MMILFSQRLVNVARGVKVSFHEQSGEKVNG
jgi:hypothetical protein